MCGRQVAEPLFTLQPNPDRQGQICQVSPPKMAGAMHHDIDVSSGPQVTQ
jgi:hypothetical protein